MRATQHSVLIVVIFAAAMLILGAGCTTGQKVVDDRPRDYVFWPPAPDEPRVQFLVAFNSSADVTPPQSRMDITLYGQQQALPIVKPYGVAMWQGKIYICDVRMPGITVFDLKQHLAKAVGVGGSMEIAKATDVAITPDGYKYVVDGGNRAIVVLDPSDRAIARFANPDFNPVSVALYGDELFVADYTGQTIRVLNRATGEHLRSIGGPGPDDGQFVRPLTVRVNPSGEIFVVDVIKSRVQRFSRDGAFLGAFGQPGNNPGDLARPKHMSFDKAGHCYIVDGAFANVQVFDEQQRVVGYFGSPGLHPGAMNLPVGVYVDENPEDVRLFQQFVHPAFQAERLILVTNQFGNQRVSVYAGGRLKPGKTPGDIAPARAEIPLGTMAPTTEPATQRSIMFQGPMPTR